MNKNKPTTVLDLSKPGGHMVVHTNTRPGADDGGYIDADQRERVLCALAKMDGFDVIDLKEALAAGGLAELLVADLRARGVRSTD